MLEQQIQGIKKTLGVAITDGFNLLRFIKAHPDRIQDHQVARQLSIQLKQVGNTLAGIESHKKLVSTCFTAASIGLDSQEGLANLVFQQSVSKLIGDMTSTGMSPTDPLSLISYCHQNIVITNFNAITFQFTAMNLNLAINGMHSKLKISKEEVKQWAQQNPPR